jgi:hypothetical protein
MVISVRPIQDRDRNVEIARLTQGMDQAFSQMKVWLQCCRVVQEAKRYPNRTASREGILPT